MSSRKTYKLPLYCLFALLLLPPFLHAEEGYVGERKVIRQIHVEAYDAFDARIPEYRRTVFKVLNAFHMRTSDGFIRREILFREGDQVDRDLLEETERNLRDLKFLDNVLITETPVDENTVDLTVHTEDQWTLQFNISAGLMLGKPTFDFSIEESNFLGLGKTVGLAYTRDPERNTYAFAYKDPQFFNSRWNFNTGFERSSDGWRFTNDFVRPFYSIDSRWAYGASWDSGTFTHKLYDKGKTAAEIDTDHRTGIFFAARAWGQRYDKRKLGGIFNADSILYPHPARIILTDASAVKSISKSLHPIDRQNLNYGMMFEWDRQKWVEERYLDNFGKIEDMPDGFMFGVMLTRSKSVDKNPDYTQLFSLAQYSKQVTARQYFNLYGEFSGHQDVTGMNNVYFNGYAHYYFKLSQFNLGNIVFPRQTLAANLSATLTKNLDQPFQASLGEDEGLRGYTFKSLNGQNRILFNIEDRIFTPLDFRIIAIGLATFMDAGYVWYNDEHLRFSDVGVSAGFGLRIGLKKSQSSRVIRVDFAVPLGNSNVFTVSNPKGWSLSVSSGQIFTAIGQLPKLFQLF